MNNTNIKLIKHIQKYCDDNYIWNFKNNSYKDLKLSENDFRKSLNELQLLGFISYKLNSVHKNDWKYGGKVTALKPLITYREEVKAQMFSDIYDIIKWPITLLIIYMNTQKKLKIIYP